MLNKLILVGICLIIVISVIILIINLNFSDDFEKIEKEAITQIGVIGEIIQEKGEKIDEIQQLQEKHYELSENEFEKLNTKTDAILKDTTDIKKKDFIVQKKNVNPRRIIKYRKSEKSDVIISDYNPKIHPIPQSDIEKIDKNSPTLNEMWDEKQFWNNKGDIFLKDIINKKKENEKFLKDMEEIRKKGEYKETLDNYNKKNNMYKEKELSFFNLMITDTQLTPKKVLDKDEKRLFKQEFSINPIKSRHNILDILKDHENRIKKLEKRNNKSKSTKKIEMVDCIITD